VSVVRPSIPLTPFVPRPGGMVAQWGVAAKLANGSVISHEVWDPADIAAPGQLPITWHAEGDGSGVQWARVMSPYGFTAAIVRAVPLS
jgi:hypothetical protein